MEMKATHHMGRARHSSSTTAFAPSQSSRYFADRRIWKRHGLRLSVSGIFTADQEVDVDVVLGIAKPLASIQSRT